ncbi:MAG: hypothetical protein LBU32_09235 [Clostridiales bacterium]|nr:hypothetical protein [Clostridiales bacterium]
MRRYEETARGILITFWSAICETGVMVEFFIPQEFHDLENRILNFAGRGVQFESWIQLPQAPLGTAAI